MERPKVAIEMDDMKTSQDTTGPESDNAAQAALDVPDLCFTQPTDSRRIQVAFPDAGSFMNNRVQTTKYTILTFLPKFLFEQFRRVANVFFLCIALLQQIPNVSPTGRFTTVTPLLVIFSISAIKEIIEDWKRYRADNRINNAAVQVFRGAGEFAPVRWMDVMVGDVVKIVDKQSFPADLVLLSSSEPEGICYIETSNLDGETNLKIRKALPKTATIRDREALRSATAHCVIECEQPTRNLYEYNGAIELDKEHALPLCNDQMLLRGSVLRNTKWVFGVVVYTGHETKVMLNSRSAPLKRSTVDRLTNQLILALFVALLVLTLVTAVANFGWNALFARRVWYVPAFGEFGMMLITAFIMFHTIIPISLQVTLEIVRYIQAYYVNCDEAMYDRATDTPALARTSNLNEELGTIQYVFTDKTGTLTRNVMEFRKCSIAAIKYGDSKARAPKQQINDDSSRTPTPALDMTAEASTEGLSNAQAGVQSQQSSNSSNSGNSTGATLFKDPTLFTNLASHATSAEIDEFLVMMAVCHTVVPERSEDESAPITYQASSPDEGALVRAAASLGYVFIERSPDSVTVLVSGERRTYNILNVIEFTSDRKRMSVLVRMPDGRIVLMVKGADSVIYSRLAADSRYQSETERHLEEFASIGLRTLCFARATISEQTYATWSKEFYVASVALHKREQKIAEVAEKIEQNLHLLGATAIEDKLQDGVPQTIAKLGAAGIKIWMLTGDKEETAVNIGYSCRLLTQSMSLISMSNLRDEALFERTLSDNVAMLQGHVRVVHENLALIVDGQSLLSALSDKYVSAFLDLALSCKVVVCCRVSPAQKAEIVELVKLNVAESITLAIGDGANDVGMIQAAHVGVGISGMEGLQAACASDYAIAQFRYLEKLLLVHGAWNYRRMCKMIYWSFYKNICLYIMQFYFAIFNGYSGQVQFDRWLLALYNLFFTSWPAFSLGLWDRHCSERLCLQHPVLYQWSQRAGAFDMPTFLKWVGASLLHSSVIYFMFIGAVHHDAIFTDGKVSGWLLNGVMLYSFVIVAVCLKCGLEHTAWNGMVHFSVWGSIICWFIALVMYARLFPAFEFAIDMYGTDQMMFTCPLFYLVVLLVPLATLMIDITYIVLKKIYKKDLLDHIREMEAAQKDPSQLIQQAERATRQMGPGAIDKLRSAIGLPSRASRGGELTFSGPKREDDKFTHGYAFSQEEAGVVAQSELIRCYHSADAKPTGE